MNDQTFADELRAVCEDHLTAILGRAAVPASAPGADGEPGTPEIPGYPFHFAVGQTADDGNRPLLVIYGKYKTYPRGFRMGELHLMLRSHFGDENSDPRPPDAFTHQARFETIYNFFLGSPNTEADAKANLRSLVNARGKVVMADYGPMPDETIDATVDGQELVTTLHLGVAFQHAQV